MNTCNTCIHDKVCNHNIYGFEDCEQYISIDRLHEVDINKLAKDIAEQTRLHTLAMLRTIFDL